MSDVRLITWNLRGSARPDLAAVAKVLVEHRVDVAVLQEVQSPQASALATLSGLTHVRWDFKHNPFGPLFPKRAEGLALLSRWPLHDAYSAVLSQRTPRWSYKRRIVQFASVSVPYTANTRTNSGSERGANPIPTNQAANTPTDDNNRADECGVAAETSEASHFELRLANLHLASHHDAAERIRQARSVLQLHQVPLRHHQVQLQKHQQAPQQNRHRERQSLMATVIAGDFNAASEPALYRTFDEAGLRDAAYVTETPLPTNPTDRPMQRLDRIFVDSTLNPSEVWTPHGGKPWTELSDHLPVIVTLTPAPGEAQRVPQRAPQGVHFGAHR